MTGRETLTVRVLRTAVTTGMLAALAVWGHTHGGGMSPGPGAALALVLLTAPLAWFAGDPRASRGRQLALVLLAQALGHAALMTQSLPLAAGHHGHAAHAGAGMPALGAHAHSMGTAGLLPSPGMLLAHLFAALLALVLLSAGPAIVRWVLGALPVATSAIGQAPLRPITHRTPSCCSVLLLAAGGPRAPPLLRY